MSANILITGAAGYIGGSIIADFTNSNNSLSGKTKITAAVRSKEQADALSKDGIDVLRLDLSSEKDVTESVLSHSIDIVIHTASSIDSAIAVNLISALGRQKQASGKQTHFIHTSGLSAFCANSGWPSGFFSDTDEVFETEKKHADSFPLRRTDIDVIEHAKKTGVTSYIVVPSLVYGRGTGSWNQLSALLPMYISAVIKRGYVAKFPENVAVSAVHISDMTSFYGRFIERILAMDPPDSGERGYYFALAHGTDWHEVISHFAVALKSRGLTTENEVRTWSDDEDAAEALGIAPAFVGPLFKSGETLVAHNEERLGWKPTWIKEKFYEHLDDEIQDVLDLGKPKSGLLDALNKAAV